MAFGLSVDFIRILQESRDWSVTAGTGLLQEIRTLNYALANLGLALSKSTFDIIPMIHLDRHLQRRWGMDIVKSLMRWSMDIVRAANILTKSKVPKQGYNANEKHIAITRGRGVVKVVGPKWKWGSYLMQ
ncbi:hypothetical protein OSB04_017409 [Centaurea solstitialis]|uniref:Uncharacterized protein n=1 Tax=Centaurea solstitialis TaxID=347529 RepID=A0AA38T2V3_9ASTR|nr:hypothetical protein OSB04_017409 [Centaurea solstitialis]